MNSRTSYLEALDRKYAEGSNATDVSKLSQVWNLEDLFSFLISIPQLFRHGTHLPTHPLNMKYACVITTKLDPTSRTNFAPV